MKKLIDIENLVIWTFQNEAANLHDIGPDATAGYPQDSTIRCEQVSLMGGFIQGTAPGARVLASDSHGDAVTVTDAMAALDPLVARLVAKHAKTGTRPDWKQHAFFRFEPRSWDWDDASGEEWGEAEPVPIEEDHVWESTYRNSAGRTVKSPVPRWVPILPKDDEVTISRHREEYLIWWGALYSLGVSLYGALADWELSDHMPEHEPWANSTA